MWIECWDEWNTWAENKNDVIHVWQLLIYLQK